MTTITGATDLRGEGTRSLAPVRVWLYAIAVLIVAMILVGGATRPDRFRPVDHRVAADPRHHPAAQRRRVAGGIPEIPADPGIPARQPGHDA